MKKFSKKHYIAVAEILNMRYKFEAKCCPENLGGIRLLASDFIEAFSRDNIAFDAQKFVAALDFKRKGE